MKLLRWLSRHLVKRAEVVTDNRIRMPDGGHTVVGAPYIVGNFIVEAGTGKPIMRISGPGGSIWTPIAEDDPEFRQAEEE